MNANTTPADAGQAAHCGDNGNDVERLMARLHETYDELWDRVVDPYTPFYDDGEHWLPLASPHAGGMATAAAFTNEAEHAAIRAQCRALAQTNEFAINGHENRISFVVGTGHVYAAVPRKHRRVPQQLATQVQAVLEEFLNENRWSLRQQELLLRKDRDGEAFLRYFPLPDGRLRVRMIEPGQVATPAHRAHEPAASFGIETDPRDVENVLGYWVDGELVAGGEIQHRKANVDRNVKRGLPLFYPVRDNLRRVEKLLRNMSIVAEIQSAIALIRKHRAGTKTTVQQFVRDQADEQKSASPAAPTRTFKRYRPGTILDAHGNVDYDFPVAGLNAANYVRIVQAELRAIAARLVMPEFMLSSDASNAAYASTLVAEGPAMKMFARLQAEQIVEDLEVLWRAVQAAIDAGRLPGDTRSLIEIQASPPRLTPRNEREEVETFRIELEKGILSPQTWSRMRGLDYEQEQANWAAHRRAAAGSMVGD